MVSANTVSGSCGILRILGSLARMWMLSESDRVQADPLVYTDFTVLRGRGDWESRPWAGAPSRSTARHTWNRAPDRLTAMKLSP